MASAVKAGMPRERILNLMGVDEVREWLAAVRNRFSSAAYRKTMRTALGKPTKIHVERATQHKADTISSITAPYLCSWLE